MTDSAPAALTPGQAAFLAEPELQRLFDLVEGCGGQMRVNGGAVRNALLGEPVGDVDLSTPLTPTEVMACLGQGGVRVIDTGAEHGTVTAIAGGRGYEITTLREDVETHGRRAVVSFGTDWQADAMRRDFTMNALYCDRHGALFDPLGGYGDLVARRVRFIGKAEARILEDHLRILRFFRLYAWYGSGRPDAEGLRACVRLKDRIAALSAERVWQETKRLLSAPDPTRAVLWMRTGGILGAALPETGNWGTELLGKLVADEQAARRAPDPLLRLMSLVPPRHDVATGLALRLKMSRREGQRLADWAGQALPDPDMDRNAFARLLYRGVPQAIADVLALELAREHAYRGETARAGQLAGKLDHARRWERPKIPIAGAELAAAGFAPGPGMGDLLSRLENWWVERDFRPGQAELLAEARRLSARPAPSG